MLNVNIAKIRTLNNDELEKVIRCDLVENELLMDKAFTYAKKCEAWTDVELRRLDTLARQLYIEFTFEERMNDTYIKNTLDEARYSEVIDKQYTIMRMKRKGRVNEYEQ